jgi:hypothetical protein
MAHNVLGLLLSNLCERVVGGRLRMQQLVELSLQRLRIAVLYALDEQSHEPDGQSGNGIPIECIAVEDEPEDGIKGEDAKGAWMRG